MEFRLTIHVSNPNMYGPYREVSLFEEFLFKWVVREIFKNRNITRDIDLSNNIFYSLLDSLSAFKYDSATSRYFKMSYHFRSYEEERSGMVWNSLHEIHEKYCGHIIWKRLD